MAIIKNKKFDKSAEKEIYAKLLKELKEIDSPAQLEKFLNKFMTPGEITLIFRRIAVVKLLENKKKYRDIRELLGISSGTISKVADIVAGRGYSRNPNRKRVYSAFKGQRKRKRFVRKHKGLPHIIDLL